MRQSVFIMGLTLLGTAWGCASSGTTTVTSSKTTVGLQRLGGDVVLSGETPDVGSGKVAVDEQTVASSGLWMATSEKPVSPDAWADRTDRLDRVYKLVLPPDSSEAPKDVVYLRDRRSARQ